MEKNSQRNKKLDKEKLEAIKGLLRPRKRNHNKSREETTQDVTFRVEDVISCLLRVSMRHWSSKEL